MTRCSQMHRTDKYSEHSSIIWPVWPNGWVFVYELSGSGFESSYSHLNFRFGTCFEQGVPWHLGHYRVWIHSEKHTWHDKNIQSYWMKVKHTRPFSVECWCFINPILHSTSHLFYFDGASYSCKHYHTHTNSDKSCYVMSSNKGS